ncbi:hypothetical protein ACFFWC_27165 [Plantactinospora siamensis]|uniref:Peptidoglycan-binding protein n=1 Tax=Plantactinospora siamensis TaxID=555372 RepID=A0ABV6NYU6_9ACTN
MSDLELRPLTAEELAAECGSALPTKEVMSLLDLNVNLDLALDLASPIDLAVAANAQVAAPIDAAVSANVLSSGSDAGALAHQGTSIDQTLSGSAIAHAPQDSGIDQSADGTSAPTGAGGAATDTTTTPATDPTTVTDGTTGDPAQMLNGNLLNVNVEVHLDTDFAAPVAGAVAANANVAAPIDAGASANIASIDSHSTAIAEQTAIISQHMDGVTADALADQHSQIDQ